ncbi:MAG: 2-phospho-L-lactate transferase CofD family protein, partial [Gemmatimonadota bacterium]
MTARLKVVLFTGGRGSRLLTRQLVNHPNARLTLLVNGYDDGKSTGEIRRFLGDALGPSDFRKNVHFLAREMDTVREESLEQLDHRLPDGSGPGEVARLAAGLTWPAAAEYLGRFIQEVETSERPFSFSDCSVGNVVFGGCYLAADRDFNQAVARYCELLGIPDGLIENVTDGSNALLVGLTEDGDLLPGEAEIVEADAPQRIREIHLVDRRLTEDEIDDVRASGAGAAHDWFEAHRALLRANPRALERLREADLIVYAPGTQHSSLFPSYLTPGVGEAIGHNLEARKLLITNIQEDAETGDASAVDLIGRAVYYLRQKDTLSIPAPCLITHYLLNDPQDKNGDVPYVQLGAIDRIEDPRLVRVGNYEEAVSGRHDARKVVAPFMESMLATTSPPRIGVLLLETESHDKVVQSVLETLRSGIDDLSADFEFFYRCPTDLDTGFTDQLPFPMVNVFVDGRSAGESFRPVFDEERLDYLVLFDSSGMYRGEDMVSLVSHLMWARLDAVWGSRRLSVRDIQESYRFRYRRHPMLGAISYIGSHTLSLVYLSLYGRYVSDALSGVRMARREYLVDGGVDLDDSVANQQLLSTILRLRGEIFE